MDENMEKISVIIPTYNYGHFLQDALESALNQTYKNIEVIVVDDGSTDNTQQMLKPYEGRIINIYKKNAGLSAARNTGIEHASGEYIAILDSDDVWHKDKLRKQLKLFENDSDLGVVSCYATQVDNDLNFQKEIIYDEYISPEECSRALAKKNIISGGSSALIKAECFDKVGHFDETLNSAEDWDMWLRINQFYTITHVKESLVSIRSGSDNMSSIKHAKRMLDNEIKVIQKQLDNNALFKRYPGLGQEALSYRHFCAAWAYWQGHENGRALKHILKSFWIHPPAYFKKEQFGLFIKIVIGSILRLGIPVNTMTKPFFDVLYKIHVAIREVLILLLKFFYVEPLFRSQCAKVGRHLWMEQLPYITGRGVIEIGDHVRLSGKPNIGFSRKLHKEPSLRIANKTFIGHGVRFAVAQKIEIGQNCYIAGGVCISDNDGHPISAEARRKNEPPKEEDIRPVKVGDDVWIGREAVILKGVTIGDRAVVGTRSVVTQDVPQDTIVVGNPAREIKKIGN